jgi:hypothetical protein
MLMAVFVAVVSLLVSLLWQFSIQYQTFPPTTTYTLGSWCWMLAFFFLHCPLLMIWLLPTYTDIRSLITISRTARTIKA